MTVKDKIGVGGWKRRNNGRKSREILYLFRSRFENRPRNIITIFERCAGMVRIFIMDTLSV